MNQACGRVAVDKIESKSKSNNEINQENRTEGGVLLSIRMGNSRDLNKERRYG